MWYGICQGPKGDGPWATRVTLEVLSVQAGHHGWLLQGKRCFWGTFWGVPQLGRAGRMIPGVPGPRWTCYLLLYTTITTQPPGTPSKTSRLPPPRQDVVNCVGGMGVLLPLLEQVVSKKEEAEDEQETNDLVGPELTSSRNAQGMLIPLGRSSGEVPEWGEAGAVP